MNDMHHVFSEKHGKHCCIYCGQKLDMNEWHSELFAEKHYKVIKCDKCRKKSRLKMMFMGSGHDNWSGLEKRVMKDEKQEEK